MRLNAPSVIPLKKAAEKRVKFLSVVIFEITPILNVFPVEKERPISVG